MCTKARTLVAGAIAICLMVGAHNRAPFGASHGARGAHENHFQNQLVAHQHDAHFDPSHLAFLHAPAHEHGA